MRRALIWMVLALLPTLAFAQAETTGKLSGTVKNESNEPIAGAEVVVTSPALQGERKTTSNEAGKFLMPFLPPGLYEARISAPTMSPQEYKFRVGVGQTVPLDVQLALGDVLAEEVDVYAPAVRMETTAGGESFNYKEQIDLLPVTNRTIDNVATLSPNISFGPTTSNNTLSISGAPSYDNSVLLDGSDISDPFYSTGTVVYVEEAIEEVQVMTNGVSARYGRFQGGVINATTKSGGNTFDGTFRADLRNQSWNSQTPFDELQVNDLTQVYSATFGGPIVQDHLWFFVGGRTIPAESESHSLLSVLGESFTTETTEDRFQLKLTGAIAANHTLEGSYLKFDRDVSNYDPFEWAGEQAAVIPQRTDPREFYTIEYQGVLTERTFVNAQLAKREVSIQSGGDPNGPSPILEKVDGVYRAYANGWFDPNDPSQRNNESAALNLTNNFTTSNWGSHTLEYGLQYVNSITAGDNRQSPTGFNLYLNEPTASSVSFADCTSGTCLFDMDSSQWSNVRLVALPGAGEQEMENFALYATDSWEWNQFRFDLGLRWEKWEGNAISPAMTLDFDDFAPRIGVTYNVTSDWQLQAAWGKYISRFSDSIANGISGISSLFGPGYIQAYTGGVLLDQTAAQIDALLRDDSQWGPIQSYVNPLQPTNFFADDVEAPYATDLNLAIKRALPKSQGTIELRYTRRQFENLLDDYVGGLGNVTVTQPDSTSTDVNRRIWDNCNECRRDYEAITATFEYRPGSVWNIGGNYTYSFSEGNYEGEANGQPAIGSIIGNYPNNIDPSLAYPYGNLLGDVRHRLWGWGNYRVDFDRAGRLTLGGLLFYRSGSAYSNAARITLDPLVMDPAADYSGSPTSFTGIFGGRGANNFNGFWSLDSTVRYDVKMWRQLGAFIKFDVRNITGNDELVTFRNGGTAAPGPGGVLQFTPNTNYGTPSSEASYQTPRSFFLALGVNW